MTAPPGKTNLSCLTVCLEKWERRFAREMEGEEDDLCWDRERERERDEEIVSGVLEGGWPAKVDMTVVVVAVVFGG